MSSWELWTKRILVLEDGKTKAADVGTILGLDGKPWCTLGGEINIEGKTLKDIDSLYTNGVGVVQALWINEAKYMVIRSDDKEIVCKCGTGGLTISKAKTCFVIGLYKTKDVSPGNNNVRVSKVREELENCGF